MAADRFASGGSFRGDIIGLHKSRNDQHRDTFTDGERLTFTGVSQLRAGAIPTGRAQGSVEDEGAGQGFVAVCARRAPRSCSSRCANNDLILGAVGQLQFEVVAFRLQDEYSVQCVFDNISVHTARWVTATNEQKLEEFRAKAYDNLAVDHSGRWCISRPPGSICN